MQINTHNNWMNSNECGINSNNNMGMNCNNKMGMNFNEGEMNSHRLIQKRVSNKTIENYRK